MSSWIWLDKNIYPQLCDNKRTDMFAISENGFCMAEFEREYTLDSEAVLQICADARYELYINEKLSGRGPATPGADFLTKEMRWCYYDEYEIKDTSSVKIRVVVTSTATAMSQFTFGHPCLYAALVSNGKEIGGTDKSWRARRLTERKGIYFTDYTERADEWSEPEILSVSRDMQRSRIDKLCAEDIYPANFDKITVEPHKSVGVCLNFDKIYSAYPELSVKCNGPVRVSLESGEIDGVGRVWENFDADKDVYHRCQRMRSVGYMKVNLENMSDSVAYIDEIKLSYSHYPIKNETGLITSDSLVNKIYDVCMHTLKICRQDIHLDSPTHQEPLACTGDYYIQALMEYLNIYDPSLTAFDIYRTAEFLKIQKGRMFHTSYSLIFPMWLYDYYTYTGDKKLLLETKSAMECLFSLFNTYVSEENGLLEYAPDYMFVDWIVMQNTPDPYGDSREVMSHGKTAGFSLHHPPKALGQSVLCMFYYRALICGAEIFKLLDDAKSAEECMKKAENIKNAINLHLYDKDAELYIGGLDTDNALGENQWLPENVKRRFYLKQANVLAVLFDIAPRHKKKDIMEYVAHNLRKEEMQPYFYHFLLEAVYKSGLFEKYGLDLIRKYEGMINKCDKGLCEAWEYIDSDCSHAWGGAPAYILKKALAGFEIIESGYKKIKLSPKLYGLDFASFGISTPYGEIKINLSKERTEINVPEGIEVL